MTTRGQAKLQQTPAKPQELRVRSRKLMKPVKSASRRDPRFKGVTIRLTTFFKKQKNRENAPVQLMIGCRFSLKKQHIDDVYMKAPLNIATSLNPSVFKLNLPVRDLSNDGSYSMNLNLGVTSLRVLKECVSCGVFDTPLWRDLDDVIPLCNACGIRFKKYRVRCVRCWYIPRKEEMALSHCTSCGYHYSLEKFARLKKHVRRVVV